LRRQQDGFHPLDKLFHDTPCKVPDYFRARLEPDQRRAGSISPFESNGKRPARSFAMRRQPC
jgi:hypothetical protein